MSLPEAAAPAAAEELAAVGTAAVEGVLRASSNIKSQVRLKNLEKILKNLEKNLEKFGKYLYQQHNLIFMH